MTDDPEIKLPGRKGLQTAQAQLRIIGAGLIGMFDVPLTPMLIGGEMPAMSFGPEEDWQATRRLLPGRR